jgi:hypothetical protein
MDRIQGDQRTANRFNKEAPASIRESTSEARTLIEPVAGQAPSLPALRIAAVATEARVATRRR